MTLIDAHNYIHVLLCNFVHRDRNKIYGEKSIPAINTINHGLTTLIIASDFFVLPFIPCKLSFLILYQLQQLLITVSTLPVA